MKTIEQLLKERHNQLRDLNVRLTGLSERVKEVEDVVAKMKNNDVQQTEILPLYGYPYLDVGAVTGDTVTVDGVDYLVMDAMLGRKSRISHTTQIVHLVDYVRVDQYGKVDVTEDGWTVSNGTCFLVDPFKPEPEKLPVGTLYKIVDFAHYWDEVNGFDPGTLAVRRVGYDYPKP
jgi:hypothetical protein